MVGSSASYFTDPNDLMAAWQGDCRINVAMCAAGSFSASVTRIRLQNLSLVSVEEAIARILFVRPPAGSVLMVFSMERSQCQLWAGVPVCFGEIATISGVSGVHGRTQGPCRWGAICCSADYLSRTGRILNGTDLTLPAGVVRWRPSLMDIEPLISLFSAAMRLTGANLKLPAAPDAARGLEQELAYAIVQCVVGQAAERDLQRQPDQIEVMAELECTVRNRRETPLLASGLAASVGIPVRRLRTYCQRHLGVSLGCYLQLLQLQDVYRDLCKDLPGTVTVAAVMRRHGVRQLRPFARAYRNLFGEWPSETLQGNARSCSSHPES